MAIKVFLVEDHHIVRQGIKSLLETEPEIEIVGEASNGKKALEQIVELMPDLVLMDLHMPVMNGLECTRFIKKEYPVIKVLILSMHDHESYLIDMLDAGADGYVLKNTSKDELLFAIQKVAAGGIYICPEFTLSMLTKYKQGSTWQRQMKEIILSERESQILDLIAEGYTNVEMANKLFISVRTIESHRKKLLEKTGTTNTATLIKFSVQNGLVK